MLCIQKNIYGYGLYRESARNTFANSVRILLSIFFRMVDANEGNIITLIILVIFVFVARKGGLLWRLIPKRGRGYINFY